MTKTLCRTCMNYNINSIIFIFRIVKVSLNFYSIVFGFSHILYIHQQKLTLIEQKKNKIEWKIYRDWHISILKKQMCLLCLSRLFVFHRSMTIGVTESRADKITIWSILDAQWWLPYKPSAYKPSNAAGATWFRRGFQHRIWRGTAGYSARSENTKECKVSEMHNNNNTIFATDLFFGEIKHVCQVTCNILIVCIDQGSWCQLTKKSINSMQFNGN